MGKDLRTYADRKEALSRSVIKRRKKVKEMAIAYKGGKCHFCGYSKSQNALEFHHLIPEEKEFGIAAKGYTRSWEKVKQELDSAYWFALIAIVKRRLDC